MCPPALPHASGQKRLAARMRRLAFAAAIAASLGVGPVAANTPDELKALRARIETLKKEIEKIEGDRAEAADALKESEKAISEANRALRDLAGEKGVAQDRLQDLGRRSKAAGDAAADRSARLSRLIHDEYVQHKRGYLQMLFSGENPAAAAREIHYASYVSRAQAKLIDNLRADLAQLQRLAAEARDRTVELAEIETRQKAEREHLARESQAKKKVLTRLSTQIRSQRREVSTLERNEKRLTDLVERLAKLVPQRRPGAEKPRRPGEKVDAVAEAGLSGAFASLRGKLRLPSRGELSNRFGSPRPEGGTTWKGLFIRAAGGEDVRAVAPGRVVFADWLRGFGNLIIVDHGNEYLSIYGNNESVYKQVGDAVASGDAIAKVGNSGGNPETGLYFELRHQGKPFDPLSWVRQ
ncbi:MAG: peptidoglycan DD-metalloendopeptidase family protein [Burkholderiales bacterium]|nr:peptidoglycan DD-metalloendopeptidase family protein [Burkholderiales bacterium]